MKGLVLLLLVASLWHATPSSLLSSARRFTSNDDCESPSPNAPRLVSDAECERSLLVPLYLKLHKVGSETVAELLRFTWHRRGHSWRWLSLQFSKACCNDPFAHQVGGRRRVPPCHAHRRRSEALRRLAAASSWCGTSVFFFSLLIRSRASKIHVMVCVCVCVCCQHRRCSPSTVISRFARTRTDRARKSASWSSASLCCARTTAAATTDSSPRRALRRQRGRRGD